MANPFSNLFKKSPQDGLVDGSETLVHDGGTRVSGGTAADYESRVPMDSTVMVSTMDDVEDQPASSEAGAVTTLRSNSKRTPRACSIAAHSSRISV